MRLRFMVLVFCLWQCKELGDSNLASIRIGDDALKIAVNYIGDSNCEKQYKDDSDAAKEAIDANKEKVRNLDTHLLSGKNGELISDEFKEVKKKAGRSGWQALKFSGDRFFAGDVARGKPLTMESIKNNCRRLVLSVDSDTRPTITFAAGFALKKQSESFAEIALPEFGERKCLNDQPFCTFSRINNGNRYFSLIWPDQTSQKVSATVGWTTGGIDDQATITIPNLTYKDNKAPQAWASPSVQETSTPLAQLQATLPEPFIATDIKNNGRGRVVSRIAFATLSVVKASMSDEGIAEITLKIRAKKKIGRGTIEIKASEGAEFIENSAGLQTTYMGSSGKRRVKRKYPAGKYGFSEFFQDVSVTFKAPLDDDDDDKVTFHAYITRYGSFGGSNTKIFESDLTGDRRVVIRFREGGQHSMDDSDR